MTSGASVVLLAFVLLDSPPSPVSGAGERGPLAAGQVIYLSTRLESDTRSAGRKVIAGWSRPGAGIQATQESGPYAVEACAPLTVRKVVPDRSLVTIKDRGGMKHTLAGDWTGRIHASETECRERFASRPDETIRENRKLQYELPPLPESHGSDAADQSSRP